MKSILITGASGGMGRAAVRHFAGLGYQVFALDRTEMPAGNSIIPVKADITDESALKNALEQIKNHTDSLYAIIHFAGVYMLDSLAEMPAEDFRRIFEINLTGAFLVNKTFLPLVKKGGHILITTSELAPLDPLPFTGVYAVSKSALDKYAYSLRMELQLLDISVSVLRAGAVSTGMLGASTRALDAFCENTRLYSGISQRFRKIVNSVEARSIPPEKIAEKAAKIVVRKNPRFSYSINRNPLLLLLNLLPRSLQFLAIKLILK